MIVFQCSFLFYGKTFLSEFLLKLLLLPGVELTGESACSVSWTFTSELRFLPRYGALFFGGVCALFQTKCMIRSQNWSFPRYSRKADYRNGNQPVRFCYMKLFG